MVRPRNGQLFHGIGEPLNDLINQTDVAVRSGGAAGKLRNLNHLRRGRSRNGFDDPSILIWLHQNRFDVIPFHFLDDIGQLRSRWRSSGVRFEKDVDLQAEAVRKVGPGIMVSRHMLILKQLQGAAPPL